LAYRLKEVETPDKINAELKIRVKAFSKSKLKANRQLGKKLASCGKTLCGSAACPRCCHLFRKWSFAEFIHLCRQYQHVKMMTLLMYSEMMPDKKLFTFDFKKLFQRLWKQLQRSGFTCPVLGYIEFDYHADCNLWFPHFHLMILGNDPEAIKKFRIQCNKHKRQGSTKISRPLHVSNLKDEAEQISYLCKSYSSRIETYINEDGKTRTRKYRLNPSQLKLSLRVWDRLDFTGRLFLYRARRVGSEIKVVSDK